MPILDINLLAKQQSSALRFGQANVVVGAVAGVIVGLQLLIVVFLYSTIALRSQQKNELIKGRGQKESEQKKLDKADNALYPNMSLTNQAKAYQAQVDAVSALIDNHKYFSLYLSEIALNTPTTAQLDSVSVVSNNQLSVTGRAVTYADVSRLVQTFSSLSFAKQASINDAKLDSSKVGANQLAVKFILNIDMKPAGQLNLLPKPGGQRSPAPVVPVTASPSPSPSGASAPGPGGPR